MGTSGKGQAGDSGLKVPRSGPQLCSVLGLGCSNTKLAGSSQHNLPNFCMNRNPRTKPQLVQNQELLKGSLVYKDDLHGWNPCWSHLAPLLQIHHTLQVIYLPKARQQLNFFFFFFTNYDMMKGGLVCMNKLHKNDVRHKSKTATWPPSI